MKSIEFINESEIISEGLGDYIFKKIDDFLNVPKPRPMDIEMARKRAPTNLPDDVAAILVAKFMEGERAKRLAAEAAEANRTVIEKIVPYLTYFARAFVERWRSIPQRDRDNALKNLALNLGRFLMFILQSLISSKK